MRKGKLLITALCLTLIGSNIIANASVFGGKWPKKWLNYKVDYSIAYRSGYNTAADGATSLWTSSTGQKPGFQKVTIDSTYYDVLIRAASAPMEAEMLRQGMYGFGFPDMVKSIGEDSVGMRPVTYEYGEVWLCLGVVDSLSSTKKKQVLTHELGHILGLDHCTSWFTSSVMDKSDVFDLSGPTAYDINDIRALYP